MNDNKEKLLVKNYLYNTVYNILAIILPMLSIPYVTRRIPADMLGTYNYTQSIVYFFVLFGTLGMGIYSQREIAFYREDEKSRNRIFWELFIIRTCGVSISLMLFLVYVIFYSAYLGIYLIQVLDILAAMIDITWFFQGQEDFKKPVVRNIFIKIAILLLTFVCIRSESDLYTYVFIHSALQFVGNISLWGFCKGKIKKCAFRELHCLKHIKEIFILFIPQIVVQIYSTVAKPMLGVLTNTAEVAYYEQAMKIIRIVTTLVTAVGTVMLPRMSKEFQKKDSEQIKVYMNNSYHIIALIGFPLMFGLMLVSPKMVVWFYGEGYRPVGQLIVLLAPIILISGISGLTSMQFLIPSKRQKEYTISIVCGSVVNIILNIIFITHYAARGAALASVISELIILICQIMLIWKEFKLVFILWKTKRYCVYSLIMSIVIYIVTHNLAPTIMTTIIQALLGGAIYFLILFIAHDPYLNKVLFGLNRKRDDFM